MERPEFHSRMLALRRQRGGECRDLRLGREAIRIEGLDAETAVRLDRRWPGFIGPAFRSDPFYTLRLFQGDDRGWLDPPRETELYRVEPFNDPARRVIASYHFAFCQDGSEREWRAAIEDHPHEPRVRLVENALRCLAVRVAAELGGLALHAAGVVRDGRAYVFAGPSRSGKTTAVGLSAPCRSLGDDFAIILPGEGGWVTTALPFDNASPVAHEPDDTRFPVAGIWRLHPAPETRVERPPHGAAVASLMGCAAMPWIYPESAAELLERATLLVAAGLFAQLHFTRDPGFWTLLVDNSS